MSQMLRVLILILILRRQQEAINRILEHVGHFSKYITSSATNLLPLNPTDHYIVLL